LKKVASPETLDRIATNALGLRLEDQDLAAGVYTDLRDQVIRAPERWHDVDVSVTLSPWGKGPATGHGSMFVATIRWEYRVTPASGTLRFACTSDHAEYRDLLRDPTVTGPWYISRNGGLDAASQDVFELVQVAVNGKAKIIRRTTRPNAQLYTVSLGRASGDEVAISYTYRVLVQRHGHVLYLDLPRPAKGLHVQLNYAGAGIRRINTLDYIASNQQSRVDQTPDDLPARTIDVGFDGWVFPRSGVAFVGCWTRSCRSRKKCEGMRCIGPKRASGGTCARMASTPTGVSSPSQLVFLGVPVRASDRTVASWWNSADVHSIG
jgi:hypothetical protein